MFENENSIIGEQIAREHYVGYFLQLFQGVGRVGEDEVKLLVACFQKPEHVASDGDTAVGAEFCKTLFYEGIMVAVSFHAHHVFTTS